MLIFWKILIYYYENLMSPLAYLKLWLGNEKGEADILFFNSYTDGEN